MEIVVIGDITQLARHNGYDVIEGHTTSGD